MDDLHFYEQRSSGVVVVLHEILTFFYYEHSEAVRETVLIMVLGISRVVKRVKAVKEDEIWWLGVNTDVGVEFFRELSAKER